MKKKELLAVLVSLCLLVTLTALPFLTSCAKPTPTPAPAPSPAPTPAPAPKLEPITLRMVTFIPTASPTTWGAKWLSEGVKELTKGQLIIDIIGGPEAIPGDDQPSAVRSGVVDLVLTPPDESLIPETITMILSPQTPSEERESGYYDLLAEVYKKQNVVYLGRAAIDNEFLIMLTKKRVETPKDLAGLKFRASGTTIPLIKALGAVPVSVPLPDVFTAMERGVVDATISVSTAFKTWGLAPVVKYTLNHPLYGQNLTILVNLDSWNKLSKDMQKAMIDVMARIEREDLVELYEKRAEEAFQAGFDEGMQLIEFSPSDAKWLVDLAHRVMWEEVNKKSPEYGPRFQKLLVK